LSRSALIFWLHRSTRSGKSLDQRKWRFVRLYLFCSNSRTTVSLFVTSRHRLMN